MRRMIHLILIINFSILSADSLDVFFKEALKWRNIGPFRGGRSLTAIGVPSQPLTYYFGSVGVVYGKRLMAVWNGQIYLMAILKQDLWAHWPFLNQIPM